MSSRDWLEWDFCLLNKIHLYILRWDFPKKKSLFIQRTDQFTLGTWDNLASADVQDAWTSLWHPLLWQPIRDDYREDWMCLKNQRFGPVGFALWRESREAQHTFGHHQPPFGIHFVIWSRRTRYDLDEAWGKCVSKHYKHQALKSPLNATTFKAIFIFLIKDGRWKILHLKRISH